MSVAGRPEYVACVALTFGPSSPPADVAKTWCGRPSGARIVPWDRAKLAEVPHGRTVRYNTGDDLPATVSATSPMEWMFVDGDHALMSARRLDRMLICPECAAAMIDVLYTQTWDDPSTHGAEETHEEV